MNLTFPATAARHHLPATLAFAALTTLLISGPSLAKAHGKKEAGLKAGQKVPSFMLPVVAGDKSQRRWGPAKWTGPKAKEDKKLVVMSFFATYCKPCKKEMPELVRIYNKYKDQGLGVMLISIDKGKDKDGHPLRDVVIKLAEKNKVSFPVMHDRFQVVARRYQAERLPYMLMVGPDGVVKRVHVGYTEKMKANLENEIRGLLGLPALAADKATKTEKGA